MAEEKEESQIKIDDWEPNTVITPRNRGCVMLWVYKNNVLMCVVWYCITTAQ